MGLQAIIDAIPPEVVAAGAVIGTGLAASWNYLKTLKRLPQPAPQDVVLAGAAIADMQPVRDLARSVEHLSTAISGLADVISREIAARAERDERELERELDRLRAMVDRQPASPAPRRRR